MVTLKDFTHKLKRLNNLVLHNKQHHRKILFSGFDLKCSHLMNVSSTTSAAPNAGVWTTVILTAKKKNSNFNN